MEKPKVDPKTRIIIGQRGWVWWCPEGVTVEGDNVVARGAQVIRTWGTTKGLAQLLESGPTEATRLETPSRVRIHTLAVVAVLSPEE